MSSPSGIFFPFIPAASVSAGYITGEGSFMGKKSRDIGVRGELKHRDVLRALGLVDAQRGRQYAGGPGTPDVKNGIPGTHAEVKFYERHAAVRHLEQAERDAPDGAVPYAALREKGMGLMDEMICVRARDLRAFAELVMTHTRKGTE
jgi:hypothetical protein